MVHEGAKFGHYTLRRPLGKGGMGAVYVAFDERREREVALKVLPDALASDSTFRDRFKREARIAALLEDPHVVPIHDFGEINGQLFMDMRWVRGRDLREVISDQGGPLPLDRTATLIDQVGQALDAAHAKGLIHRDVKPANILVTDRDFVYLTDFGIASQEGDTRLTQTGVTVGSFTYMAPERFDSSRAVDERVDIYALGCVLYEILTGQPPFPGKTLTAQAGAHMAAPRPRASVLRADLRADIDAVIAQAMAVDPAHRFHSCAALSRAVEGVMTGGSGASSVASAATQPADTRDTVEPPEESAVEPSRRRGLIPLVLVGLLVAAGAAGGATLLLQNRDHGDDAPDALGTAGRSSQSGTPTDRGSATESGGSAGTSVAEGNSSATTESAESPSTVRSTVRLPSAARYCATKSAMGGLRTYVAYNDVDQPCAWALNVADAVHSNGGRAAPKMDVYSPARKSVQTVTCRTSAPIRCRSDGAATAWVILADEEVEQG